MNIGIHFFDLLLWLFGPFEKSVLHLNTPTKMSGALELEWARVRWYLSVDGNDLPAGYLESGRPAFRSITIDGEEVEFSEGFTDLHTMVYKDILDGGGFGIEDARSSIDLVYRVRHSEIEFDRTLAHPMIKR